MTNLRFAVVGCGNIGKRHAMHIQNNPWADLVIVCDIREESAKKLSEGYGCKYAIDYRKILSEKVDVVNICTPNHLHASMTIDALKYRKHVVCEKPMCLTVKDGMDMIKHEKKSGKRLFIVKQNRYNPPVKAVKQAVQDNAIGKPIMCCVNVYWNRHKEYYLESEWKGKSEFDGGALYTQCSHFIDLMIYLNGKIDKVFAYSDNYTHPEIDIDDTGIVLLKFENGSLGSINYTTSVYKSNYEGSLSLFGEKGAVKIGGQYLNTLEHWDIDGLSMPKISKCAKANDYGTYRGSMSNHDMVIENVIQSLQNEKGHNTTSEEGLETIKVIEAIYRSTKTKKEEKV